jgi:hypothetical protein
MLNIYLYKLQSREGYNAFPAFSVSVLLEIEALYLCIIDEICDVWLIFNKRAVNYLLFII